MSKKSSKKVYIKIDKPIEVGDLVRCVEYDDECKPGDVRRVGEVSGNHLWLLGCWGGHEKSRWEPVRKEVKMNENHRAEIKQEVAEMIVELLDRAERNEHESLLLTNYRRIDNSIRMNPFDGQRYDAHLSPSDTWDTLTGVYVALSKATGRKLPDWIYGEG